MLIFKYIHRFVTNKICINYNGKRERVEGSKDNTHHDLNLRVQTLKVVYTQDDIRLFVSTQAHPLSGLMSSHNLMCEFVHKKLKLGEL